MFIVIEGPDGVGKTSTQALVETYLVEMGYRVEAVREPGETAVGESIRDVLMKHSNVCPLTQLLLFSASRNELMHQLQVERLPRTIFLFDRYTLSSYVYQHDAYFQNRTLTEMLFEHTFPRPDLTFVLNASIQTLLERTQQKTDHNHFDVVNVENVRILEDRRNAYLAYARAKEDCVIVDTERPVERVASDIVNVIVQEHATRYGSQ